MVNERILDLLKNDPSLKNSSTGNIYSTLMKKGFSTDEIQEVLDNFDNLKENNQKSINKKTKYILLMILLIIISSVIFSYAYILNKPVCGNGMIEKGETQETCCLDTGCFGEQKCNYNTCIDPVCNECQYLENSTCVDYGICSVKDCQSSEYFKDYQCYPLKCNDTQYIGNNTCIDYSCLNNVDCEDNNSETRDVCFLPNTKESRCINEIPPECTDDNQCRRDQFCEEEKCSDKIQIKLITVRDALLSILDPEDRDNPNNMYALSAYKEIAYQATKAGIGYSKLIDSKHTIGYNGEYFYDIFFETKKAPTCSKDYLVQKVKVTKDYYDKNGRKTDDGTEYLVEVFRLDDNKENLKGDKHSRYYNIQDYYKRGFKVEIELGCGRVKNRIETKSWPYSDEEEYYLLQDYSENIGLYDDVVYEFSTKYDVIGEFDKAGRYSIDIDEFNISVDIE